jgi:large subunit ribosomal protein L25
MDFLKVEKRAESIKAKKLRANDLIPGCVYGGNLKDTLLIQIPLGPAMQLVKAKSTGSKVTVEVDGKKYVTLLKEIGRDAVSNKIEHLSFQSLVADEKVNSIARIVLLNREKVSEFVQQLMFEIPYKALPSDLVETIEIDLEGKTLGWSINVGDLDIAKKDGIEIMANLDSPVVNIIELRRSAVASDGEEEEEEEQAVSEQE